jgi:hypothetical protein
MGRPAVEGVEYEKIQVMLSDDHFRECLHLQPGKISGQEETFL